MKYKIIYTQDTETCTEITFEKESPWLDFKKEINFSHRLAKGLIRAFLLDGHTGGRLFDYSGYGNHESVINKAIENGMPRYRWDRKLTEKEINDLEENPWCMFRKTDIKPYRLSSAGVNI